MSLNKDLVDDGSGKVKQKTPLPYKKIGIFMAAAMIFLFLFSPRNTPEELEVAQHHQGRVPGVNETYLRVGDGVDVVADDHKLTPAAGVKNDSEENPIPAPGDSTPAATPESNPSEEKQSNGSQDDETGGDQADDDDQGGDFSDDDSQGEADDDVHESPETVPAGEEEHGDTVPTKEEDTTSFLDKVKRLSEDALHLTRKQVPLNTDFVSPNKLNEKLLEAKSRMLQRLNLEYGEINVRNMFFTPQEESRGKMGFFDNQESWDRFKCKMKMKLLRVMIEAQEGSVESDVEFIWATGGHSASAGHGNLFHDSYTAVMERTARDVFAAVGIRLIGKNYAMGGTPSAPEIAFCSKEIFGEDIDMISWDYGMTDGNDYTRLLLYFYRAGLIKSRPAMLVYHAGGRYESYRRAGMDMLRSRHIPTFFSNETVLEETRNGVPDTLGMTDAEIDQLPEMVKNFKCGDIYLEVGDPYCGAQKFSDFMCTGRKGKTSWHPGWKMHALEGNLLAFFLVDALSEALGEIMQFSSDPRALLSELEQKEIADFDNFKTSSVPEGLHYIFGPNTTQEIDLNVLLLGPNMCHTARLPSEIRYKGILTESTNVGIEAYDKGLSSREVQNPNESELMRLVYDEHDRIPCEVPIVIDYKDYFYVSHEEGAKKLIVPNDREIQEYGKLENPKGYVAWCAVICPWGKCPDGELQSEAIATGEVEIEVNGKRVVGSISSYECHLLKNDSGYVWDLTEDGKVEVQFRTTVPNSFVRVSSIVIW